MTDALASAPPEAKDKRDHGVSLARLYILRAAFAIMAAGMFHTVPHVLNPDLTERGMLDSMTHGLSVICILGIRYPLQMLPIFLFEFVWKALWTFNYGLAQWMMGIRTPDVFVRRHFGGSTLVRRFKSLTSLRALKSGA